MHEKKRFCWNVKKFN